MTHKMNAARFIIKALSTNLLPILLNTDIKIIGRQKVYQRCTYLM